MKIFHWVLVALLTLFSPGCIYVHATGDMDGLWEDDDDGFGDLRSRLDACLVDPCYDFSLNGTLWRHESEWTVSFVEAGSDPATAFHHAQDAVRHRVHREGGHITEESSERRGSVGVRVPHRRRPGRGLGRAGRLRRPRRLPHTAARDPLGIERLTQPGGGARGRYPRRA